MFNTSLISSTTYYESRIDLLSSPPRCPESTSTMPVFQRALNLMDGAVNGGPDLQLAIDISEQATSEELVGAIRQGSQYIVRKGQKFDDTMVGRWRPFASPTDSFSDSPDPVLKAQFSTCLRDVHRLNEMKNGQDPGSSKPSGSDGMDNDIPRTMVEDIIHRRTLFTTAHSSSSLDLTNGIFSGSKFIVDQRMNANEVWLTNLIRKWNMIGQCGGHSIAAAPRTMLCDIFLDCLNDAAVVSEWVSTNAGET